MELKNIRVVDVKQSATNTKGRNEGHEFDDLVASIKEKGVLVPVLARKIIGNATNWHYEVIAGSRRLAAAKDAGLNEIPAKIVEMTDDEAQEAQIVENLQRKDVHPLEEGEAYRKLIEDGHRSTNDISVKVGKSESYVRQRLFLTNLSPEARNLYRSGKVKDSVVYEIAKLSREDQAACLKQNKYRLDELSRIREWIRENVLANLKFQPWLAVKEVAKAVGKCTLCPETRETLFGKIPDDKCVSKACWFVKIGKYVEFLRKKDPTLILITKDYSEAPKGVLARRGYTTLSTKEKEHCDYARRGLVVSGEGIGTTLWICTEPKCKTHGDQHSEVALSPKEIIKRKAERKREIAQAKKKAAAKIKTIEKAISKVGYPMSEKVVEMLLEAAISRGNTVLQPVCARRKIEPNVTQHWYDSAHKQGYKSRDYEKPVRDLVAKMSKAQKVQLIVEIVLVDHDYSLAKYLKIIS